MDSEVPAATGLWPRGARWVGNGVAFTLPAQGREIEALITDDALASHFGAYVHASDGASRAVSQRCVVAKAQMGRHVLDMLHAAVQDFDLAQKIRVQTSETKYLVNVNLQGRSDRRSQAQRAAA